jgi:cysteine desulfurase
MSREIYLDHAATTPVDPAVADAMAECLGARGEFANPSATHAPGRRALRRVVAARALVAERINASPESIVFTSGATESNNLALFGVFEGRAGHLLVARTDHKSVLDPARCLARRGVRVTWLDCDALGVVSPEHVSASLAADSRLVCVAHVNNETGVVQPIAEIAARCRAAGVLLHVDAAQSIGKVSVDVERWGADLVSLSAHKAHGPKGVGALYVRSGVQITPLLLGGEQEQGRRAGTLATHQLVGMGKAYELADPTVEGPRLAALAAMLCEGLRALPGVLINGHPEQRAPHIVNATFVGIEGESLRLALGGVAVSAGAACASADAEPSHVLTSMGVAPALAASSLRFSVGRTTEAGEIRDVLARLSLELPRLRTLATGAPEWCSGGMILR